METYQKQKLVANGSYGDIYSAMETATGKAVIMKRIAKDAPYAENESLVLPKLKHPHIVELIDHFDDQDAYYLILEKAPDGDLLEHILRRTGLSESEARHMLKQLLMAIEYLHDNYYLHCDIKLENILLFGDTVKLADFGLAHQYRPGEKQLLHRGSVVYAAPEIISSIPAEGPPLDIWSLGVCLYAMIFGQHLFHKESINEQHQRYTKAGLQLPSPVSLELADLLSRMLTVDPAQRITLNEIKQHAWLRQIGSDLLNPDQASATKDDRKGTD
jgi:serine/threonine protein kinase